MHLQKRQKEHNPFCLLYKDKSKAAMQEAMGNYLDTCDNISAARGEQDFLYGARVAPEDHAVQPSRLLKGGCPGHERTRCVAASAHLLLLLTQPALQGKQCCQIAVQPVNMLYFWWEQTYML